MTLALDQILGKLRDFGVVRLYAKELAPNDNSKNQPYLGGDFSAVAILPTSTPRPDSTAKRPNLKAALDFWWLRDDGNLTRAPGAQLILYPDYPEVRLSGYLKGTDGGPNALMGMTRQPGRILFLGVTADRRIIAYAVGPGSSAAIAFSSLEERERIGVFWQLPLAQDDSFDARLKTLLFELCRVHRKGWIESKRLRKGKYVECKATQCGGYTLEAELGIEPNGRSAPDYLGWEIKAFKVAAFSNISPASRVTLMTPEPTGGIYRDQGLDVFVRSYGYSSSKLGRENRRDFAGIHRNGVLATKTGLTLTLEGYDAAAGRITDPTGCITLRDSEGQHAASWSFAHVIGHWSRKHALAAYVPYLKQNGAVTRFRFGPTVRLGMGADPLRLLSGIASGAIIYDPGIWIKYDDQGRPTLEKKRSQFRISARQLPALYHEFEQVDVCDSAKADSEF